MALKKYLSGLTYSSTHYHIWKKWSEELEWSLEDNPFSNDKDDTLTYMNLLSSREDRRTGTRRYQYKTFEVHDSSTEITR